MWEPSVIPRWVLVLKYLLFVVVGVLAFAAGVQTLDLTTFRGYEAIWAGAVAVFAVIGFIGSFTSRLDKIEALGGVGLVSFLMVLVFAVAGRGSYSVALLLLIVTLLPAVRAGYILAHWARNTERKSR